MVDAATRWPSRRDSPWIRTAPHQRLSLVRHEISAVSSSEIGGRPGGFGRRHVAATILLCQRTSVPGVTIWCPRSTRGNSR